MFEELVKIFTRNIIPGFVFYLFVLALPLSLIMEPDGLKVVFSNEALVLGAILIGFILDGIGAYSLTVKSLEYREEKEQLLYRLDNLPNDQSDQPHSDPDRYIAELWARNEGLYDRIFQERAEWVAILNTSFSLRVSWHAMILTSTYLALVAHEYKSAALGLVGIAVTFILSPLLAKKGIQRMKAHDDKVVQAILHARNEEKANN